MKILGVKIDNLTIEEALQKTEGFLEDGQKHYIVTPNPEFLIKAQQDEEFREILNQADLAVPDGIGLVFASWFLGQPLKKKWYVISSDDEWREFAGQESEIEWQIIK